MRDLDLVFLAALISFFVTLLSDLIGRIIWEWVTARGQDVQSLQKKSLQCRHSFC